MQFIYQKQDKVFNPSRIKFFAHEFKRFALAICLLSGLLSLFVNGQATNPIKPSGQINAVKILVSDPVLARKIAISYHHALLESNIASGYLIADLSANEIQALQKENVKLIPEIDWLKKYAKFQGQVLEAQKVNSSVGFLGGIVGYDCYPTVEETYQQAAGLASTYPDLASWVDIGDSWKKANGQNGYDLMVLQITNKSTSGDKPILFIHSAMHAREYATAALTLDFAKLLLEGYQNDADIHWIIDNHQVHILFHMNPDGRKIAENQIFQRKNTNQNYCPGNNQGVDLNRNFASTWNVAVNGSSGVECDETYRGPSAESEPETQAVSNYIRSIYIDNRGPDDDDAAPADTTGMHLDIHSFSELVLWPYGHKEGASPNNSSFIELGNKLAWFNNYAPQQSIGLYPTDGTSDSVSYGELGVAALTFEIGTQFFQACSTYNNQIKPDNLAALLYSAKVVSAPYKLPFGPEISAIELNGATSSINVAKGAPIDISLTANALRTKLLGNGRLISRVEYTLDTPPWSVDAIPVELVENDGALDSGVETLRGQIDTTSLVIGQHILYSRAFNQNNQPGAVSAEFIFVGSNNSPTPAVDYLCDNLSCEFDASNSTDSDGSIDSFAWNFDNESQATGAIVSHQFAFAGDKTVKLTVTDNSGNEVEKNITIAVSAPPPEPQSNSQPKTNSGGGSVSWLIYCLGLAGLFTRIRRKQKVASALF